MKKIAKKLLNYLPFKIKLYLNKQFFGRIDEVDLVFAVLKSKEVGVMIDVGAHYGSSLKKFMDLGWDVFAFEPNPNNSMHLKKLIKGHENVVYSNLAVSDSSGNELPLYTSDVSSGISGLSKFHDSHKPTHTVKTITLADFLDEHYVENVDFLKIDTEGFDLFVLRGYDWVNHSHPSFIVCEFEDYKTVPLKYNVKDLINLLENKSYKVIISEWFPVTEYGTAHKWKRFIKGDQYEELNRDSWGNLIAVKKDSAYLERFEKLIEFVGNNN